jgi:hypothetical protein
MGAHLPQHLLQPAMKQTGRVRSLMVSGVTTLQTKDASLRLRQGATWRKFSPSFSDFTYILSPIHFRSLLFLSIVLLFLIPFFVGFLT